MSGVGTVLADSGLNFRESPGGPRISVLPRGAEVEILGTDGDWYRVRFGERTGFVFSRFIDVELEPEDDRAAAGFRFAGSDALAPDGTVFARKFRKGVFNFGRTSIAAFVQSNQALFADLAPSLLRVMEAVSANEGKLEAINTWDSAFLTFGVFQWTAGTGNSAGELPGLLERVKRDSPDAFERHFRRHGLDVTGVAGRLPRGRFMLDGTTLETAAQKERLRSLDWAYRFWRAGHDDVVRRAQIEHAIARIDDFYRDPRKKIGDHFVADYVTSEYGVALLLDQHVNRPGHVPRTLAQAVARITNELGEDRPETWDFAEEHRLLQAYLERRHQTSMTDSRKRAQETLSAVGQGLASDQRGSFTG
ncbi:MAG: SH3 domain-containing protein [Rhodospirillales bacterium]|nr:SH3 domain-containing protein [Rhodospirillales bacterium]MDH3967471.1 SH3 domain-containing protein [Rhodospirillales bacterium]